MAKQVVLVVDDEPQMVKTLRMSLSVAGYSVLTAGTAGDVFGALRREPIDAIILDLGLPDRDGKEVIAEVRQFSEVPIVVLSARHMEGEKILALDAGANDYINKPFGMGELLARLRVALRLRRDREVPLTYRSAGLAVDFSARRVIARGREVHLTPKEFDLLRILAEHAGQIVTRNALLAALWGLGERDIQGLRVLVGQLRQKIEAMPGAPEFILTEPGIGYRLRPETEETVEIEDGA
ncbi:response regulator transcription factor [Dongia sp.]|uniref:response regulator transcription factor n=1 Tax=Dongia sp. TaxID=1977262 RepID=UPI003750D985